MARSKAIPKLPFQLHGNALARWGSGNTLPCLKVPSRRPESQTVRGAGSWGPAWGLRGARREGTTSPGPRCNQQAHAVLFSLRNLTGPGTSPGCSQRAEMAGGTCQELGEASTYTDVTCGKRTHTRVRRRRNSVKSSEGHTRCSRPQGLSSGTATSFLAFLCDLSVYPICLLGQRKGRAPSWGAAGRTIQGPALPGGLPGWWTEGAFPNLATSPPRAKSLGSWQPWVQETQGYYYQGVCSVVSHNPRPRHARCP